MPDHTAPMARRTLLRGGAVLTGGALVGLAGCADDDPSATPTADPGDTPGKTRGTTEPPTAKPSTTKPPKTDDDPTTESPTSGDGPDRPPAGLGPAAAVQVGGGVIYAAAGVVVTQPSKGTFRAFDTSCTHEGCPVTSVRAGEIECPCHFSRYSIVDGSVLSGPAPAPLRALPVRVESGRVLRG